MCRPRLFGNSNPPILSYLEEWIPGDLPHKAIGVSKVSRISAPECFLCWLQNRRPRSLGFGDDRIDLFALARVVRQRKSAKALAIIGDVCVSRQLLSRKKRQSYSACLEKSNSLALRHASPPAETLVEALAALQIPHAQRDDTHPLLHSFPSSTSV